MTLHALLVRPHAFLYRMLSHGLFRFELGARRLSRRLFRRRRRPQLARELRRHLIPRPREPITTTTRMILIIPTTPLCGPRTSTRIPRPLLLARPARARARVFGPAAIATVATTTTIASSPFRHHHRRRRRRTTPTCLTRTTTLRRRRRRPIPRPQPRRRLEMRGAKIPVIEPALDARAIARARRES